MDDYLSAEPAIIARLKDQVPEMRGHFSASDLEGVVEAQQVTPAVHVLYYGDRVVSGSGTSSTGEMQCVDQLWYVVLAVRNARTPNTNEAVRADAGPLVSKVLKALQGWKPSALHGPLKRINGADPGFKAGFAYFPYLFQTRLTI
jgi:hypothetical protein